MTNLTTPSNRFAHLIVKTAHRHQSTYMFDQQLADLEAALKQGNDWGADANYHEFNLQECAEHVCDGPDKALAYPVYLALTYTWNDILVWAHEQGFDVAEIPEREAWTAKLEELYKKYPKKD